MKKTEIKIKLTKKEKEIIKKNAKKLGISMNDYIRARMFFPTQAEKKIQQSRERKILLMLFDVKHAIEEIQETGKITAETAQKLNAYYKALKKLISEGI